MEIALAGGKVHLRDSMHPDGPVLSLTPLAWAALVAKVRGPAIDTLT